VSARHARMASEAGKEQYRTRPICECIHARGRNWDLRQLTVRGIEKGPCRRALVRLSPTTSCRDAASQKHKPQTHTTGVSPVS